ncbi:MAG TPA: 5'-3' exonuclease H3TH domain-containing protein [Candidatus Absconditabacterales bacterium]|nr:5'-3' exonuclease H3TH domain-containing protein [Candidatus Absconditabacterales bacterium]
MVGDSADNIKGITGIGPKKASDLIQKYQTIDNIYHHIDEISGEVKQKLLAGKEDVYTSRGLIELKSIPEIENTQIDRFALTLDFAKYNQVLVKNIIFIRLKKR